MEFKGKEDYKICFVDYDIWWSRDNRYTCDLLYMPWLENEYTLIRAVDNKPIYEDISDTSPQTMREYIKKQPEYINNHYTFHSGDKLFFHSGCTIPRTKGENIWQRVIKQSKADAIVVPELKKMTLMKNAALFIDENKRLIYVVSHLHRITEPFTVGTSLIQVFNDNANDIHSDFFIYNNTPLEEAKDAICTYKGDLMYYNKQSEWAINMFDGPYQKVIFEDELLQAISTDEQKLTLEKAESIMTMLRSSDAESVHAGMRLLASLDYANYPSITRWILSETSKYWEHYKPFNSSVKFMFNTIDYKHCSNTPFRHVMPFEFDITKEMFADIIRKRLNFTIEQLYSMTNMRLDIKFNFDIFLDLEDGTSLGVTPEEIPEEPPEETPEPEEEPEETSKEVTEDADGSTQLELLFILLMLYMQTIQERFQ